MINYSALYSAISAHPCIILYINNIIIFICPSNSKIYTLVAIMHLISTYLYVTNQIWDFWLCKFYNWI